MDNDTMNKYQQIMKFEEMYKKIKIYVYGVISSVHKQCGAFEGNQQERGVLRMYSLSVKSALKLCTSSKAGHKK